MSHSVNKRLLDLLQNVNSRVEQAERKEEHWKREYKKVKQAHLHLEQERIELLYTICCEQCRTLAEGELCSECTDKWITREELKNNVAHWKQQYESLLSLCTCHGGSRDGPSERL